MDPKLFPVIIAMAFAFAGCLGISNDDGPEADESGQDLPANQDGDDGLDAGQGDDPPADEDSGDATQEPEPIAPIAKLDANLSTGSIPLEVSFTLDGEYPDGLDATWSFDLGDGSDPETGNALPYTYNHTYLQAGNFTAAFTLTVEDQSVSDNLTISVQEPEIGVAQPNPSQDGSNTLCLDYLVLWALNEEPAPGGLHFPLDDELEVEAGTGYTIASDDGEPAIDFFNADGHYIGTGGDSGTVPANAAYGIACVGVLGEWPEPPMPMAEFTYQDGF